MKKWDLFKLVQEWGAGRIKENDAGMNSTKIYCKHFCKCHNVLPVKQNMIKKRRKENTKKTFGI
jgi:hypothetical protein